MSRRQLTAVRLRQADDRDAGAVQDLIHAVLREYGLEPDPAGTDSDLVDLEASYLMRGGDFVVLVDAAGTVLGTAGLMPTDEHTLELRKMYFAPALRGQGWGKVLLHRMLEKARSLGARRVTLETASVLVEAIALYRSFGFLPMDAVEVPRCDQAFSLDLDTYRAPDPLIAESAQRLGDPI